MGFNMLKRLILVGFLCVLTLAGAGASERITRFVSDVDVQRNGDLLVTETIQVRAEGAAIRHGILRDFPTTYRAKDGTRVSVGFDVLEVRRDGAPEAYATERLGNGVRIRIGDAKRYLNGGQHEFLIKYRTTRQIGFFKDFDELYWNATGNGWTFPIDEAEARITLPERVAFKQTALYTGPQGAAGKDATIVEQQPGRIVFRTTKGLPYRNGLTVAAAWRKGVVAPPTQLQQLQSLFADRPGAQSAVFGGALVILFYLTAWLLVGRDPRSGTVIPLFAPPDGMSAAAVRYVDTMNFDNRCFAAAIVGLGVNGHIKLTSTDDDGEIKHIKSDKPLDAAEKAVEKDIVQGAARGAARSVRQRRHQRCQARAGARAVEFLCRQAVQEQSAVVVLRLLRQRRRGGADRSRLCRQLRQWRPGHDGRHGGAAHSDHDRRRGRA